MINEAMMISPFTLGFSSAQLGDEQQPELPSQQGMHAMRTE